MSTTRKNIVNMEKLTIEKRRRYLSKHTKHRRKFNRMELKAKQKF